jgi:hypothetical protein
MSWRSTLAREIRSNYAVGQIFSLTDLYRRSESALQKEFPRNTRARATMRNVLQQLRNDGMLAFMDDHGTYKRLR